MNLFEFNRTIPGLLPQLKIQILTLKNFWSASTLTSESIFFLKKTIEIFDLGQTKWVGLSCSLYPEVSQGS